MTVNDVLKILQRAKKADKGTWPVQILHVEGGMPSAEDIEVEIAQAYDGERVWIHPTGTEHAPEWLDPE